MLGFGAISELANAQLPSTFVPITLANSPNVIVADTLPKSLSKTFASALTVGLVESTTAFADIPEK